MARIDFYLIAAAGEPSRQVFACRLAEKAYRLQNTVHIQAADREHARQLDDLLWTFRDGSFVPHEVVDEERDGGDAPVTIGVGAAGTRPVDLLINLSNDVPPLLDSFPRVAEIVTSDEDCRQEGRRRFADYRSQGHTLQTHEL
jgi:DNA polymerase III subunit chi